MKIIILLLLTFIYFVKSDVTNVQIIPQPNIYYFTPFCSKVNYTANITIQGEIPSTSTYKIVNGLGVDILVFPSIDVIVAQNNSVLSIVELIYNSDIFFTSSSIHPSPFTLKINTKTANEYQLNFQTPYYEQRYNSTRSPIPIISPSPTNSNKLAPGAETCNYYQRIEIVNPNLYLSYGTSYSNETIVNNGVETSEPQYYLISEDKIGFIYKFTLNSGADEAYTFSYNDYAGSIIGGQNVIIGCLVDTTFTYTPSISYQIGFNNIFVFFDSSNVIDLVSAVYSLQTGNSPMQTPTYPFIGYNRGFISVPREISETDDLGIQPGVATPNNLQVSRTCTPTNLTSFTVSTDLTYSFIKGGIYTDGPYTSFPYMQDHVIRLHVFVPTLEKYDYFAIYNSNDMIISDKVKVVKLKDLVAFQVNPALLDQTNTWVRGYLICGGFDYTPISSIIPSYIQSYSSYASLTPNPSLIENPLSPGSFAMNVQNVNIYEDIDIAVQLQISTTTGTQKWDDPIRTINSDFPFGFIGTRSNFIYTAILPVLPNHPISNTKVIYGPQNTLETSYIPNVDTTDKILDIIHPLLSVVVEFNKQLPNGSSSDYITVVTDDQLGINYEECYGNYGSFNFKVSPSNKIKGSYNGPSTYLFPFQLNRYFYDEELQLQCQDIRGNSVVWSRAELKNIGFSNVITIQSHPLGPFGLKVINIDSNFVDGNQEFSVSLMPLSSSYEITSASIKLYNEFTQYVIPLITDASNPLYQMTGTLNISSILITRLFYYELNISTSLDSNVVLSYQDLLYISRDEQLFKASVLLKEAAFLFLDYIYSYTIQLAPQNNANNSLFLVSIGPLSTYVSSITLKYGTPINPYLSTVVLNATLPNGGVSSSYFLNATFDIGYANAKVITSIWVDNVCDLKNNCVNYSPWGFSGSNSLMSSDVYYPPNSSTIETQILEANPKVIDVSSQNRNVKFTYTIKPLGGAWIRSTTSHPIVYLVENQSLNKISFQLLPTNQAYVYECYGEIPLNWGSRGLYSVSVYNILTDMGAFTGFDYQNVISLTASNLLKPVIWSTTFYPNYNTFIFLQGSNLHYIGDTNYKPVITFGSSQFTIQVSYIDPTNSYFIIPSTIDTSKLEDLSKIKINIGSTSIPLIITGVCLNSCSNHGNCVSGQCQCNGTWSGVDCSINTSYQCKNNCSSNGECSLMNCNCFSGYMGPICEIKVSDNKIGLNIQPNSTAPITTFNQFSSSGDSSTTATSAPGSTNTLTEQSKKTNFTVLLNQIQEKDYKDNPVKTYSLLNWNLESFNSTTYTYTMSLSQGSKLTSIVEITGSQSKTIEFAGNNITIPQNSIKYYIKVENYTFQSSLNHLTFSWEANYKVPNPCETKAQKMTYGGSNLNDIHYIMIPANQLKLYGRFSNLIIVDDRILLSSNQAQVQNDKVTIKVNTPFFTKQVELDPDFSVLVDYTSVITSKDIEYDDQCNPIESESDLKTLPSYAIPVIIACSIVLLFVLTVVGYTVLYKYNFRFRMRILKIKESIRDRSSQKSASKRLSKL